MNGILQRAPTATRCFVQDGLNGETITYDFEGIGFLLNADGEADQIGVAEVRERRVQVRGYLMTDEQLEEGARRVLVAAANSNPSIRPADALRYFNHRDLHIGHQDGMMFDAGADGMILVPEPEFIVHLFHEGQERRAAIVWNPRAVVRLDVNAPEWVPPPLPDIDYAGLFARIRKAHDTHKPWHSLPDKRARALLYRYLTKPQKWELRGYGRFTVIGQDGETYRVYKRSGHNVKKLGKASFSNQEREVRSFCVVANDKRNPIPLHDLLLAQKLLLETDIKSFLDTAYTHPIHELTTQLKLPLHLGRQVDPFALEMQQAMQWAARVAEVFAAGQIPQGPEANTHIRERLWNRLHEDENPVRSSGVEKLIERLRGEQGRQLRLPWPTTSPAAASVGAPGLQA